GSYSTVSLTDEDYFFEEKSYSSANEFANKDFNFLHVGSMTGTRKGQPVFLETVAKLREKGYKIKASLCGEGESRSDFEQYARDLGLKNCVTFTGMLNAEEIRNKYRQSDILLLPTNGEGLPRAVIEAMSNGVLCFSSRVDGTVELLEDDCIASSNTADEYVKLIEKFLQNAQSFEDMRKKQFEISKKYESSILTANRNEFYSKLRNCVS
ncbi:MAG: glycosyltransferase family 4 protein, partial [Bifidobacteriaceae bacterium]|nr:glycosyltransferase family 4 protein [Bifidobacteriaceae bacterium]